MSKSTRLLSFLARWGWLPILAATCGEEILAVLQYAAFCFAVLTYHGLLILFGIVWLILGG